MNQTCGTGKNRESVLGERGTVFCDSLLFLKSENDFGIST